MRSFDVCVFVCVCAAAGHDNDNDNDVYFTLATSDSRIGKYKPVGEQLRHKNRSIYNAIG